jgi:AraC-like DNA-binding protein
MRVFFSTAGLPPGERVSAWREFFASLPHHLTPGDVADTLAFEAEASGHAAGGFVLLDIQSVGLASVRRTGADVAKDKRGAYFVRRFHREAIWKASPISAPVSLAFGPGDFCISSSDYQFEEDSNDGASFTLLIVPHTALSPLLSGGRLVRPVRLPGASPLASLLSASLDAASSQVPLLSGGLGESVLRNLSGLVALACRASAEDGEQGRDTARAAQLSAVKRHIDVNLADPALTPASAATALGLSVRQLHRLFERTESSFARYVLRERLLRCRDAVADATGTGRSVVDIAFGWGFNSMATFYRAFANEFGAAPAALREARQGEERDT